MDKKDLKIIFFGTPEFAVESFRKLLDEGYNVAAAVTMPDKVAGRGHKIIQSDVKKFAVERGIPVLQPEKLRDPEFLDALRTIGADLFIVIAFRMMPEAVWSMPPLGTFNLHAALLPKYRGAAPINRAIMNGETETGITTFFLDKDIDTGDMIESRKIEIKPEDNAGTIHDRLMTLGADMVLSTVGHIIAGDLKTQPQPEGDFIPAPKIFREDCHIDWNRSTATIHNQVRGLSPYPAAVSTIVDSKGDTERDLEVKVFETAPADVKFSDDVAAGDILVEGKRLFVKTEDGALEILQLQPSGKKRMDTSAFLLGYRPLKFK